MAQLLRPIPYRDHRDREPDRKIVLNINLHRNIDSYTYIGGGDLGSSPRDPAANQIIENAP